MSGHEEYAKPQTVQDQLDQLDRVLDDFEKPLGVSFVGEDEVTQEARRLVKLTPNELRKMSAEDCGFGAYVLFEFAYRLQQAVNREQARVRWADELIRRTVVPVLHQQKGCSFEERKLQATHQNPMTVKLDQVRVKAQLRIDRVSFLSAKAEAMARCLVSIKQNKRVTYE